MVSLNSLPQTWKQLFSSQIANHKSQSPEAEGVAWRKNFWNKTFLKSSIYYMIFFPTLCTGFTTAMTANSIGAQISETGPRRGGLTKKLMKQNLLKIINLQYEISFLSSVLAPLRLWRPIQLGPRSQRLDPEGVVWRENLWNKTFLKLSIYYMKFLSYPLCWLRYGYDGLWRPIQFGQKEENN